MTNAIGSSTGMDPASPETFPVQAHKAGGSFGFHYQRNKPAMAEGVVHVMEWSDPGWRHMEFLRC